MMSILDIEVCNEFLNKLSKNIQEDNTNMINIPKNKFINLVNKIKTIFIKDKNKDKSSIKYIDPNEKLNKLFGNINVQEVPKDVKHSSLGGLSKYRVEGFDNANLRRHYI